MIKNSSVFLPFFFFVLFCSILHLGCNMSRWCQHTLNFRKGYYWQLDIGLGVRVFANGPGVLGSIPGRVIPKTQKMVLDASLLNTQHYKVRIKGKVEQSREGVATSPWCSSYRKGSLRVTLDYGRQLYNFTLLLTILLSNSFNLMKWNGDFSKLY